MGSMYRMLAVGAGITMLCASAQASELEVQINEMQAQIEALQAQVNAQELETIPGLYDTDRDSRSNFAIPGGEFFGWVAGSYTYSPTNNESDTTNYSIYNGAHQGQLDSIWLGVDGLGDGNNKAGYFFEMSFGHLGSLLGAGGAAAGGQGLFIPNAFVQWNTDFLTLDLGKFGTTVGYEVPGANNHPNITIGQLWQQQSVDLAGARLSTDLGEAISVTAGVVNGTVVDLTETGDAPAVFWGLGIDLGEKAFISFNGTWEDDPSAPTPIDQTVLDVVATLEATDDLHLWVNFDYFINGLAGAANGDQWGIAAGAVLAVTDATTTALRGEYLDRPQGVETYSVTGTLSHAVTDNLTVAGEVRWDGADQNITNINGGDDNQVVGVIRTTFSF